MRLTSQTAASFSTRTFESAKGRELLASPKAALLFHWKSLERQIRIRGPVSLVTHGEADAYFASRPRLSRIGAWASHQSRPLSSRDVLEAKVHHFEAKFPDETIPRPAYWSGVSRASRRNGILDEPAVPASRSHRLSPRRAVRLLAKNAPLSLRRPQKRPDLRTRDLWPETCSAHNSGEQEQRLRLEW